MKIYTKKGDKGLTSLINKLNVPKDHQRVESYGTIDELNAHIGMLRSLSSSEEVAADLLLIQKTLFTIQTLLAVDSDAPCKLELPQLNQQDIDFLE